LASDIGNELGCGAVLYSLSRVKSGTYSLDKALSIEKLREMTQEELGDIMIQSLLELKNDGI
jgi:tRNA U55 pseudouridine synthase TruB